VSKRLLGELELNRIYQRDCIDGMRMIPDGSVDLAVVDPPYGINFRSNMRKKTTLKTTTEGIANDGLDNADFLSVVIDEAYRVLKPNSHIYWFTRWDRIYIQQPLLERYFKIKNALVWMKNSHSMGDLTGAFSGQYESIIFAQKGRRALNEVDGKLRHTDILQFNKVPSGKLRHSHEKPEELIEFLIRKSSDVGDIVLSPFCGSGTDCVAAAKTGRNFVSFELDRDHIETANKRLDSLEIPECT
jgi:site-specific DNA-methyltransferase (adenine-specific)